MRSKKQLKISFNNSCGCIVDYQLLEAAIIWKQEYNTISNRKIFLHGYYPAVTINGEKMHVHRLIMSFLMKSTIPSNIYCHHINGNKLDSSVTNISTMNNSEHQSIHNTGKKLSDDHKRKISEANRNRIPNTRRKYLDDNVIENLKNNGFTISQIARKINAPWSTVNYRLKIMKKLHETPEKP